MEKYIVLIAFGVGLVCFIAMIIAMITCSKAKKQVRTLKQQLEARLSNNNIPTIQSVKTSARQQIEQPDTIPNISEGANGFTYTNKEDFLRKLIKSAANTDISVASYGVINSLVYEPSLHLSFATLCSWSAQRKAMKLLGTNVPKKFTKALMSHIDEMQAELLRDGTQLARTKFSETGVLHYVTAQERGIRAEYYIPLYQGTELLGAIHLEGRELACREVFNLDFFNLIIDNISLVLYNIMLMQQVLKQANTDNLTKLYNRTYLKKYSETLISAQADYCVIIMDIDFFKRCNDTYGHSVGDLVLQKVAGILALSAREDIDGVFRYGGEEFVILLRDVGMDIAYARADDIRRQVEATDIVYNDSGDKLNVTISMGVKEADKQKSLEYNITCADKALYWSKEHGRNQVTKYSAELEG